MNDLKTMINKNLYLRVDFDRRYKKTKVGIIEYIKFFLIGVLPVLVSYKNGDKEKASINMPVRVGRDPYLRALQGARACDEEKVRHYKKKVKEIRNGLAGAFEKILCEQKFNDKEMESIFIINGDICAKKS